MKEKNCESCRNSYDYGESEFGEYMICKLNFDHVQREHYCDKYVPLGNEEQNND